MDDTVHPRRSRLEAAALRACGACFTLFCANVLLRAASRSLSWEITWLLDRVPEFLLLFASAVLFAAASLAAERRDQADGSSGPESADAPPEASSNG